LQGYRDPSPIERKDVVKTITLKKARNILKEAFYNGAVLPDDDAPIWPSVNELNGKPDNEFLLLQLCGGLLFSEGPEYSFIEGDNKRVEIQGSSMFLVSTIGKKIQVKILQERNLE
jgi:hypothetical protein